MPRKDLVAVTKNIAQRQIWFEKLGDDFRANCLKSGDPRICFSHFPPEKLENPRSTIAPYKNGRQRNVAFPNRDFSDSESEFDDDNESDDEMIDPTYKNIDIDQSDEEHFIHFSGEHKNILCDIDLLFPSISKCWECLKNRVHTSAASVCERQGAAITIKFCCSMCDNSWVWKSSKVLDRVGKPGRKQFEVNLQIAAAIPITGNGFAKVSSFCRAMTLPIISKTRFHVLMNKTVRPAIEEVFGNQRKEVMERLKADVAINAGVDLSGDAQFDSRGFSAILCRFSLMDVKTKCILDYEICRKERGGNSNILEKTGHEIALPRLLEELQLLTGLAQPVKSFTSDRCTNLAQTMLKYPNIRHHFDSWHWIRSIRKDIREKFSTNYFIPMRPWIQRLVNHMHYSIQFAAGDGNLAYQTIMTFFHHILNRHDNFDKIENVTFDLVDRCLHPPDRRSTPKYLDLQKKDDKKAYDTLLKIMTKTNRQKDLGSVSPFFSTSELESFHSLAASYLPKENFFDKNGYELRSKLAVLHWNALQLEESDGLRRVESKVSFYCKTKKTLIWKSRKSKATNKWRLEVFEVAKRMMTEMHGTTAVGEIEARALAEAAMYAL